MRVEEYADPSKDFEIYVNSEYVQCIMDEDKKYKIVELTLHGRFINVRGELDEIALKLSSQSKRIY